MRISLAAVMLAASIGVAAPAAGQQPAIRPPGGSGPWLGAGVGAGWSRLTCAVCARSRDLALTAYLQVGTNVTSAIAIGAEVAGWTRTEPEEEDVREIVGSIMGVTYLFTGPDRPLFLKGGFGLVGYRAGDDIALNGFGIQLGAGYVLNVGGLALTNYANLIASSFGTMRNGEALISNEVNVSLLQLGVGLARR